MSAVLGERGGHGDWVAIGQPSADPRYRGHERRSGDGDAAPVTVSVFIHDDQFAGKVVECLSSSPDIHIAPDAEQAKADVVLVLTTLVTDDLMAKMAEIAQRAVNPDQSLVLVSGPLRERHLVRAFSYGVVSILPRAKVTPRLVARAILAASSGQSILPATVTRWLVDGTRVFQQNMLAVNGLTAGGLTSREVEVLRMLADGEDTVYIAEQLRYSERTIKKIIQDIMVRLDLRNRAHAVSYALRVGVI
jgi:DNA-binding NarL/FixJ family response regulator